MEHDQEAEDALAQEAAPAKAGGSGAFAAGVLVGALLGAGLALLFAPESGARTRRRFRRGALALRERAAEGLDEATRRTRKDLIRRRRRLEKQLERLTSEARDRLADLR
jgi:gas vesicle protein